MDAIHGYFGLTYAQYKVLDRTLLQSMPNEWQERFVTLLEEYDHSFSEEYATSYKVNSGSWHYCSEVDENQLKRLGYAYDEDGDEYFDPDGHSCLYAFIPGENPVPPYDRGRTQVPLKDGEE